jgi:NhaA family Na+:H+ antiporter
MDHITDRSGQTPRPARRDPVGAVVSSFAVAVRPLQQFFRLEAASGIVLFAAAVAAVAWANSPAEGSYRALFETPLTLGVGPRVLRVSVHQLVNEGLMTVFFFVVGMEIKRELAVGELRTVRQAMLPAIAAVGGMVVPAGIFSLWNAGTAGAPGWGIPVATDIAFAIGCLTLLRRCVPHALVVFLTALAIFDDIGGILVIAFFYGQGVHLGWLAGAALVVLAVLAMNRAQVQLGFGYLVAGIILWYALHRGGIHATISGVVLGLLIPARPRRPARAVLEDLATHGQHLLDSSERGGVDDECIVAIQARLHELEAPVDRFMAAWHGWVAFLVMPLFALANSGVAFGRLSAAELTGRVAVGAALGLAVGKPLGIALATALAVRTRLTERPGQASWARIIGVSMVAGIGFTVALFIADLAYPTATHLLDEAKVGILVGSAVAGVVGAALLRAAGRTPAAASPD